MKLLNVFNNIDEFIMSLPTWAICVLAIVFMFVLVVASIMIMVYRCKDEREGSREERSVEQIKRIKDNEKK